MPATTVFQEMVCPDCRMVWGFPLARLQLSERVYERLACPAGHVGVYSTSPPAPRDGFQGLGVDVGPGPSSSNDGAELRRRVRDLEDQLYAARTKAELLELDGKMYRCPMHGCDFARKRPHFIRNHLIEVHRWTDQPVRALLSANAGPDGHG